MKTDGSKNFLLLVGFLSPLLCFVLLFPGCEKDNGKIHPAPSAGETKAVASPPVESAMSSLLELEKNPEAHRALTSSHQDWIRLRKSHCTAVSIPDTVKKSGTTLQECYEAFDRQRIEILNRQRIGRLLDAPPQGTAMIAAASVSYSAESKKNPSTPLSLVVAADAPVAAVTIGDVTELFDLMNGQLINRIQTLDGEKRRGVYHLFLSPNGRVLIASYHWPKTGFKLWDVKSGDLLRDTGFSPYYLRTPMARGRYFIYSEKNRIGVYDIVKDEPIWYAEGKQAPAHMALSPGDARLIVVRGQSIEYWELDRTNESRVSFSLRNTETVGNYNFQPTSIVFAQDGRSFYGSLPRGAVLVQWQLPELKVLRRLRFPKYQSIKLLQISHAKTFLMEARISSETLEAFAVDMVGETAATLFGHTGTNSRTAPGEKGQILIATPFLLKLSKIPGPEEFLPFTQALGGAVVESIPPTMIGHSRDQNVPVQADCRGFQIEAVGVYEGSLPDGTRRGFQSRIPGYVKVSIGKTDLPVQLLLSSYEPVRWQLHVSANTRLSEVLLAGSNESTVEGQNKTPVTFIGNAYAYKQGNLSRLADITRKHTGCSISRFQGSYRGSNFSVGERSAATQGNALTKHVDEEGNVVYRNY